MGRFENFTPPTLGSELTVSELTMLEEITALANSSAGQFIRKESGSLVNATLAETIALSGLSDVVFTGPAIGDLLVFDGTNYINLATSITGHVLTAQGVGSVPAWTTTGAGTVTMISVVTANGVSGSVATETTTPAITLTLGSITPSAVQISGLTASEIILTDASKNLVSAAVVTYPSLTELSYVKGLSSAIQTQLGLKAPLASPTFTGTVTIPLTPSNTTDAASKGYVDGVAQGLSVKGSVLLATAAALPTNTYLAGVITITATGTLTVDGTVTALNDRILVKDEVAALGNGIYKVTTAGAVGVAAVLTRSTDMDIAAEFPGAFVFVETGTVNAAAGFVCTNSTAPNVGTDAINWTQFSGAGEITAGTGMTKTANTLNVIGTASRITANADSLDIASDYVGQTSITTLGTIATGAIPASLVTAGSFGAGAYVISTSLQAATIELGHATDSTITRVSAGLLAIEGNNILTANTGAAIAQTFYIGTTQVAINRASAALTLAGITLTTPDIGTPSAGVLTNATGLPAASVVAGILGVTGTRMTKLWATDIESTNEPTVGGVQTKLLLAGGTMTGSIVMSEDTRISLDRAALADGQYVGTTIEGTAGAALAFGDIIYFAVADSRWELADATAAATGVGMIGICVLAAAADASATRILLHGFINAATVFPALTVGAPVYLDDVAGDVSVAIPTGADTVIRVLGMAMTADEMYWNPSQDVQITVA